MTSTRRLQLLSIGAAIILVVIWYVAMWSPQAKNVQKAHKANAAATQKIGQLQSQASQLETLVKQIPADNARFTQLEAAFPENPQFDQALNLLQQAANQTGIIVTSISPSKPPAAGAPASSGSGAQAGGVPAVSLTISVQGTTQQLEAFMSALDALPRTVVIDKVSMGGGASNSASINARIFYDGKPTP